MLAPHPEGSQMKLLLGPVLAICLASAPVMAADAPPSSAADLNVVATMKQLAQDWGDAIVAGDADKLARILAEDWSNFGASGKPMDRDTFLDSLKAGKHKLESFELGPMDVKVLGDVAVVQGIVTEKRTDDGKDTSGKFVWMDVFVKRADKWVCVRSTGFRAK
jgi:ketosteroid isomerase-like protein